MYKLIVNYETGPIRDVRYETKQYRFNDFSTALEHAKDYIQCAYVESVMIDFDRL